LKKLFLLTLFTTLLFGYQYDAKLYVGLGGGSEVESYTNTNDISLDSTSAGFGVIKFGYGDQKAYAIEFALNYIANSNHIFSTSDGAKYSLDITFIKAYPLTSWFYPFAKVGFGAGEMEVNKATLGEGDIGINLTDDAKKLKRDRISYSSYNIGFGGYFPLSSTLEFEVSYLYRYNSYQSLDYNENGSNDIKTLKLKSHINQIYFGINKRF